MTMLIPLSKLTIDPANPRTRRDPAFIRQLAANIAAEGVIEPLHVKGPYPDGTFGVVNGGSRLEALRALHAGEDPEIHCEPVPGDVAGDAARLRSAALAVNVMRAALHPVDEFEAFAALVQEGFAVAHVAERYGVEPRIVRQRLALARLAPEIRAAWRAGDIDAETAETFTLSDDQKTQAEVFRKLSARTKGAIYAYDVRAELVGERGDARKLLAYIGAEAYEAAGGRLARFLFSEYDGEDDVILDYHVLKRLADERIEAECARLKKQGWAFAEPASAHRNWRAWRQVAAKTKAEKAEAGCIVFIGHNGRLVIERGLLLPGKKPAKASPHPEAPAPTAKAVIDGAASKDEGEGAGDREGGQSNPERAGKAREEIDNKPLPSSLAADLSAAFTWAAQDAVATDFDLALRLAVAALTPDLLDSPVKLSAHGLARPDGEESGDSVEFGLCDFVSVCRGLQSATREELLKMLAARVAASINLKVHTSDEFAAFLADEEDFENEAAFIGAECPMLAFVAALDLHFAKTDFFARAGKMRSLLAIEDVDANADIAALMKKPAKELAAIAADKTRGTGWLPAELRSIHYQGPAAKAVNAKDAEKPIIQDAASKDEGAPAKKPRRKKATQADNEEQQE